MRITEKLLAAVLALALVLSLAACAVGSGADTLSEDVSASEPSGTEKPEATPEPTAEPTAEPTPEPTEVPKEIVPVYYDEQPDIPTVDSITAAQIGGKGAMGPMENGKYLELYYSYRTDADGNDNAEAVISDYISFVSEQGFSVREVASPDEYAALNTDYHSGAVEDEKEIYHIFKDETISAVISRSEEYHRLTVYLMDAWKPGEKPDASDADAPKETAYGAGTVYVAARKGTAYYDFKFTDGVLVSQSYEDETGKEGFGEDSSVGIEYSKFYGMTVEELSGELQSEGYTITTGDDLYEVMMESIQ